MKTSAIKFLMVWINKKKSKKEIILSTVTAFLVLIVFSYFFIPSFFNYETNKTSLEKKINDTFKINTKISGKVAYKLFPSPRIKLEKVELGFNDSSDGRRTKVDTVYILMSPFNLSSLSMSFNSCKNNIFSSAKFNNPDFSHESRAFRNAFLPRCAKMHIENESTLFFFVFRNGNISKYFSFLHVL